MKLWSALIVMALELNLFSSPLIILTGIWLGTLAGIHREFVR